MKATELRKFMQKHLVKNDLVYKQRKAVNMGWKPQYVMFKATVTEMAQNAATRCADVQVAVLTDRIENKKKKTSIISNKMPFNIHFYFILTITSPKCRFQWSRGLRCRSSAARLLRLWVSYPAGTMDVCPV